MRVRRSRGAANGRAPCVRGALRVTETLLAALLTLFVVVDPVGVAVTYAAMSHAHPPAENQRMAIKGVAVATGILVLFYFAGRPLLAALGIGIDAFRIAGGILLFVLALDMVLVRPSGLRTTTDAEAAEAAHKADLSVFPLAFPLLAGPGAITTVILMATGSGHGVPAPMALTVIALVMGGTLAALVAATRLARLLGETGANVVTRLLGLLLAALAVQFVLDGVRGGLALS